MKKTYAVSDLHGYFNLYEQIKNFIQPEDKVIFLGDATDRGPQSLKLAKAIYADPQFTYLKGNHEDMLVKTALDFYNGDDWYYESNLRHLLENGGDTTWDSLLMEEDLGRDFIYKLKNLKTEVVYYNAEGKEIHLCHAGFTPGRRRDLLWDRKHLTDILDYIDDNYIIVHGHTPVAYQRNCDYWNEAAIDLSPEFYANGHKINIDMGTYGTKACCLLDLDTFEYHIFTVKD